MSKHDVLYVRDMNISDEEEEQGDEDVWDDRKLNDAYDKALQMANAEVAKRVAMSTNSRGKIEGNTQKKTGKSSKAPQKQKKKWKAGMPCRTIYEEDGVEYEACVLAVLNDSECVVRFLGYHNSEIVSINSLKPTKGEDERAKQIVEALASNEQTNEFGSQSSNAESLAGNSEQGDRLPINAENLTKTRSKSPKKKKKRSGSQKPANGFDLQDMPFPMPNISMFMNAGCPEPPPPPALGGAEDQALSSMLLSWYMSGYYTGLYQGLKKSKENRRNK